MQLDKKNFTTLAAALALLLAGSGTGFCRQDEESLSVKGTISRLQEIIREKGAKWQAGETELSGLSPEEWKLRTGLIDAPVDAPVVPGLSGAELPADMDWRTAGGNFVTGVRNQGSCGSCWAFAMTAALESYVLLTQNAPGAEMDLSEQIVLSCSGGGSCSGGYLNGDFIKKTGVPPEKFYAYTASNGSCSSAAAGWQNSARKIIAWGTVPQNLSSVKAALVKYGPVPISMAIYSDFMHYKSGIYSHVSGSSVGGHAVLLVGYNDAEKYFTVKNSWGVKWGEDGYFRIAYSQMDNSVDFARRVLAYYPVNPASGAPEGVRDAQGPDFRWSRVEPMFEPLSRWPR